MNVAATRRSLLKGALGSAFAVPAFSALGQPSFPSRPIKWICFQAAGGSMDLTMRALQPALQKQGVKTDLSYVEGGAGNIARTQLYNSAPDGYTLVMDANPAEVLGEFVPGSTFKSSEFEPVYGWDVDGYLLVVKKGSPIHTFKDLFELSKKRPVTVASIGRGSSSHLQLLILQKATGIRMNLVHFNGSGQSYPEVIGGNVDASIGGPASALQSSDQLQFICVFRPGGEPALPGVQSLKAQGYDVQDIDQTWYTYAAPKTPEDRLNRLEDAFAKALRTPEAVEAQKRAGFPVLTLLSRAELKKIRERSFKLASAYRAELH
jgi:tripartite-type tricarboxylate transporter receptor subunit TctC